MIYLVWESMFNFYHIQKKIDQWKSYLANEISIGSNGLGTPVISNLEQKKLLKYSIKLNIYFCKY